MRLSRTGKTCSFGAKGLSGWERAQNIPELDVETLSPHRGPVSQRNGAANPKLPLRIRSASRIRPISVIFRMFCAYPGYELAAAGILSWLLFSRIARGYDGDEPARLAASKTAEVDSTFKTLWAWLTYLPVSASQSRGIDALILRRTSWTHAAAMSPPKAYRRYAWIGLAIALVVIVPTLVLSLPILVLSFPVATGGAPRIPDAVPGDFSAFCCRHWRFSALELVAPGARGRRRELDVQRNMEAHPRKYLAAILGHCCLRLAADTGSADRPIWIS